MMVDVDERGERSFWTSVRNEGPLKVNSAPRRR